MNSSLSGRKILITGGRGYLAANFIRQLAQSNCEIVRLERAGFAGSAGGVDGGRIELGELGDPAVWERVLEGVDVVFHFAAQTSIYTAWADPVADLEVNVLSFLRLLETCRRKSWQPAIFLASSATVVGLAEKYPVEESIREDPVTIYDLHKLAAEKYLKHYVREGMVRGAALRLANVYGPGPTSSSPDRGILNLMMRRAIKGEDLTIYGDGQYVRDYVYVDDVARAFVMAATHADNTNGGVFFIGSGRGQTIREAIELVGQRAAIKTGRSTTVRLVPAPAGLSVIENRSFVADTTRFSAATGWTPRVMLADGIDKTLDVFLARETVNL
jgi:nucleoside-diphosphate-sugar epimerase